MAAWSSPTGRHAPARGDLQRGNTAPVAIANPTVGTANPTTGAISGSINIKDWDGDPLTYTTVSVDRPRAR